MPTLNELPEVARYRLAVHDASGATRVIYYSVRFDGGVWSDHGDGWEVMFSPAFARENKRTPEYYCALIGAMGSVRF
jgi:hypothetical protein